MTIAARLCLTTFVLLLAPSLSRAGDAERVVVEMEDGVVLRGELDARTDGNRIWLRISHGSTVVLRPLARTSVVRTTTVPFDSESRFVAPPQNMTYAELAHRALFTGAPAPGQ